MIDEEQVFLENMARKRCIIKHNFGSISYGTNTKDSDVDFRGVFIANPEYRTPFKSIKEVELTNEEDSKLYELHRFIELCSESNPTYLETLFVDEKFITHRSHAYDFLRKNRECFLSQEVARSYLEFANGQYKRILGHDKWMNNPQPESRPEMVDFVRLINNFREEKVMPKDFFLRDYKGKGRLVHYSNDIYGLYLTLNKRPFRPDGSLNPVRLEGIERKESPDFLLKFNKTEYEKSVKNWKDYWHWKKNRNPVRSALEEKFGYDTKHGLHIVRMLRMSLEIIETGKVNVFREDAEELNKIRYEGTWSLDDISNFIDETREKLNTMVKTTNLPKRVNPDLMAKMCVEAERIFLEKDLSDSPAIYLNY